MGFLHDWISGYRTNGHHGEKPANDGILTRQYEIRPTNLWGFNGYTGNFMDLTINNGM